MKKINFIIYLLITGFIITGCDTENIEDNPVSTQDSFELQVPSSENMSFNIMNSELQKELANVRAATAKYLRVEKALEDGYVDINYPLPNMGRHFLKLDLLDGIFDLEKPEVLVYSTRPNGEYQLVAVEYGIPVDLSPDAPEGFTGGEDVWVVNQDFNLWVVHAWIWKHNPDGMFNPTNPLVE